MIICVDSYYYFGTDDLYLNYLANFVKPGGVIAIVGSGLMQEIEGEVPEHLREWWSGDLWSIHSAAWFRRHWERTGIMSVEVADIMPNGWQVWLDWQNTVCPDNVDEITALKADQGNYLGYVRLVGRRKGETELLDYCWPDTLRSSPVEYTANPLLRSQ